MPLDDSSKEGDTLGFTGLRRAGVGPGHVRVLRQAPGGALTTMTAAPWPQTAVLGHDAESPTGDTEKVLRRFFPWEEHGPFSPEQ